MLLKRYPRIAAIDCKDCAKFAYNMQTGEKILHAGKPIPVKFAPCEKDKNVCKKVRPGYSDLSPENREIYEQYLYFRESGKFPDDMFAQRYKSIIEEIESLVEEGKRMDRLESVILRSMLRLPR